MELADVRPSLLVAARFAVFLAQAVLFGLVPVVLLVLRPAFAELAGRRWDRARDRIAARLEQVVTLAVGVAAAATLLLLYLQASVAAEFRGATIASPGDVADVLATRAGQGLLARLPLLVALLIVLRGRVRTDALAGAGGGGTAPPPAWWGTWAVLGVALLTTVSLTGHAVTDAVPLLAVPNDVVHLGAGAVWLAGVVVLVAVVPLAFSDRREAEQLQVLAPVVVRFSRLALVAIPLAGLTGLVSSYLDVGALSDLRTTAYGQALAVKVWLFAWVVAFGGFNHYVLTRRLVVAAAARQSTSAAATFALTVTGELLFALLLLGSTAVLVGLPKTG